MWFLVMGVHKNMGTDLEISKRSQCEWSVSAGPEVSLVWGVQRVGKVTPLGTVRHGPVKGIGGQKKGESHQAAQMVPDPSHRKGLGMYKAGRTDGRLSGPCEGILSKMELPPCQQRPLREGSSRNKFGSLSLLCASNTRAHLCLEENWRNTSFASPHFQVILPAALEYSAGRRKILL